jgi:hypothetical protein
MGIRASGNNSRSHLYWNQTSYFGQIEKAIKLILGLDKY